MAGIASALRPACPGGGNDLNATEWVAGSDQREGPETDGTLKLSGPSVKSFKPLRLGVLSEAGVKFMVWRS